MCGPGVSNCIMSSSCARVPRPPPILPSRLAGYSAQSCAICPRLQTHCARSSLLPLLSLCPSLPVFPSLPLLLSLPAHSHRLPSIHTTPLVRATLQRRPLSVMVAITPLRTLTLAMFGLAASSALAQAQTNSVAVVNTGSASGQDVDASSLAAEYHAAGNSTQVPTDIVITSPTSDTVW